MTPLRQSFRLIRRSAGDRPLSPASAAESWQAARSEAEGRSARSLRSDRRGAIAVIIALLFPVFIAFALLGVDATRLYSQALSVSHATQLAALAAGSKVTSYYNTHTTTALSDTAQTYVNWNAPTLFAPVGAATTDLRPVPTTLLGNWSASRFTSLAASGGKAPDSVAVTGSVSVNTIFGGLFGHPSFTITKTAIASVGSPRRFNVVVLNNSSTPGGVNIDKEKAADQAILDCMKTEANDDSEFGVTSFSGTSRVELELSKVSSDYDRIKTKVTSLEYCGQSPTAPACNGSNVASGLYSAIAQFSGPAYANSNNNIVIITDSLPTAKTGNKYSRSEGTDVDDSAGLPIATVCSDNCSDIDIRTMAKHKADEAGAAVAGGRDGIKVSTIYYSGSAKEDERRSCREEIHRWKENDGVELEADTPDSIVTQAKGVCSLIGYKLSMVSHDD